MIRRLLAKVNAADPDVIENHNLHGFDLPFLNRRARKLGVPLGLGRIGKSVERSCCCAVRAAARVSAAVCTGRTVVRADMRAARAIASERERPRLGVSPSGFGSALGAAVVGAT